MLSDIPEICLEGSDCINGIHSIVYRPLAARVLRCRPRAHVGDVLSLAETAGVALSSCACEPSCTSPSRPLTAEPDRDEAGAALAASIVA